MRAEQTHLVSRLLGYQPEAAAGATDVVGIARLDRLAVQAIRRHSFQGSHGGNGEPGGMSNA